MTFPSGRMARISLVLVLVGAGVVMYALLAEEPPESDPDVINMEVDYAFEPSDKRQLVGFATNVFVGRVVEKVGTEGAPLSGPGDEVVPRTQFSVEVLKNIKGDLSGHVTVSQTGGYDKAESGEVRVEGDPLLKPGQEHLFVTSYVREEDWYAIVAQPFGDVRIEGRQQRTNLVENFEQAREEQILPNPGDPQTRR
jgi:hypothetical protein